jgi:diguanylate cyclase (GGDEF)-like protein/putative nucleotidyltransferase with HDIG domain
MAFSLELAGGASMGFVFLIFALGRLSWLETLLMADAALVLLAVARRDKPDPARLLKSLVATSLAVISSHAVFRLVDAPGMQIPLNYLLGSTVCFLALYTFETKRDALWSFPYYVVAAAVAALVPAAAGMPVLLLVSWLAFRAYERRLNRQYQESEEVSELNVRTMETLALAIEARDPFHGHSRRVRVYTAELARELGLSQVDREALRAASLLYDIGELAIPEHILFKSDKLTAEEVDKVRTHPQVASEILERVQFPYPVAPIVLAHHERWDGAGYPRGLKGENIPIAARILAVADAVNALVSPRRYRAAYSLEEAVASLAAESGRAYDPRVVSLVEKHYREWERRLRNDREGEFTRSILAAQHEARVLFEFTAKLAGSLNLDSTYTALEAALRQLVPFDALVIWIEEDGFLTAEQVLGDDPLPWSALRIAKERIGAGTVQGGGVRLYDTAQPGLAPAAGDENPPALRWVLCAPLSFGETGGALTLYSGGAEPFTQEHSRILGVLAPKLSAAITNELRFREVRNQAGQDPMTGLPNAAALASRLERLAETCTVVMCDLNGFKQLNDKFGHLTGNQVLKSVAYGFRSLCREGDFVARTGGDEFVLLLSGCEPVEIAPRIREFEEMVRNACLRATGQDLAGASFGTAYFPADGTSAEELLATADRRMYLEKGRRGSEGAVPPALSFRRM